MRRRSKQQASQITRVPEAAAQSEEIAAAQVEEPAKDREKFASEKEMPRLSGVSQRILSESDREKIALQYLEKNDAVNVSRLHDALWGADPFLKDHALLKAETADLVWRLADEGKVELGYLPVSTFAEFLRQWGRTLWAYALFPFSLATILAIYVVPADTPLVALRWLFGSVFVVFIPGYVAVKALFPKPGDLGSIERFALSIGLSLALVVFVGLFLNYTPLGIRLLPIVISLMIMTLVLGMVALVRQYRSI